MSEGYTINFATTVDPFQLAELVTERWGISPAAVYAGAVDGLGTGPQLDVMILTGQSSGSDFDVEFTAGETLAAASGHLTELEMATTLCRALDVQAIVSDGGMAAQCQMLVTSDGWHGRVVVDDNALEEGQLRIAYAYQPVPSVPDINVQAAPEWQAGWYEGGEVPEAGYLDVPS